MDHVACYSSRIRYIDTPASLSGRPQDNDAEDDLVGCTLTHFREGRHPASVARPIELVQGGFYPVAKPRPAPRYGHVFVLQVNHA